MIFSTTKKYLLQVGKFTFEIESDVSSLGDYLFHHYDKNLIPSTEEVFVDYQISVKHCSWHRRIFKPQVEFRHCNISPFKPLPLSQAHALLEWGMNWVLSTQAHQYWLIHSASLEKNGKGIIIAAPSGAGKSTLCAYLASQGWRLLSDELAMIDLDTLQMHGLGRPISLKNQSIDVMKPYFDDSHFSQIAVDTHKGTICLLKPPLSSIEQASKSADPKLIVFVNYNQNEKLFIETVQSPVALTEIIQNSFNFGLLNLKGFQCAKRLVTKCDAIYVEYSDLQACEQALSGYLSEEEYCDKAS